MVMGMAGRHLMTNVKYVVHYAFECYTCTCGELRLAICVACAWLVVLALPVIPAQLIKSGILYWPNVLYVHVYTGHFNHQ